MSLAEDIKSLAFEAGFHAVGITSAEPFPDAERALQDRLEQGLLEGSGYNADAIRLYTHPRESLPTARSIISVALSYLTDDMEQPRQGGGPRGWMARFSRGLDYHDVLQERLFLLAGDIQAKLRRHVEICPFADTGPLVDRSVAIRAGIGSHGKNTCVYVGGQPSAASHQRMPDARSPILPHSHTTPRSWCLGGSNPKSAIWSSWVVLGELLTDLELEPDEPAALDICGECDECMRACPTGSICAPYVVDVKICLSQATQSKGFIPHWLREKMATRIYGCDTCQSACPLNKGAKPGNVDEIRPSAGLGKDPELLPLLNISPNNFKTRVAPTTAGWIGRTRFRRNVAVALGNVGDPMAVPHLVESLSDSEPVIRGHAAWALGKIGIPPARLALENALSRETDDQTLQDIRRALDISE